MTDYRFDHGWLLFLLPVAGVVIGSVYHRFGKSVEGGNNVIVDEIHERGDGVPPRIAPLIFAATVVTHLFGGSAGREGTAVQIGGGVASAFNRWFELSAADLRTLLMAGVAAGFGAVFGTPIAGAVFAMEVLAIGRMDEGAEFLVADLRAQLRSIEHLDDALVERDAIAGKIPRPQAVADGVHGLAQARRAVAQLLRGDLSVGDVVHIAVPQRVAFGGAFRVGLAEQPA